MIPQFIMIRIFLSIVINLSKCIHFYKIFNLDFGQLLLFPKKKIINNENHVINHLDFLQVLLGHHLTPIHNLILF